MPRKLSTNIGKVVVEHATLDLWGLHLKRNGVNPNGAVFDAEFSLRDDTGVIIEPRIISSRNFNSLTPATRAAITAAHDAILAEAEREGLIPPGVDTPDL